MSPRELSIAWRREETACASGACVLSWMTMSSWSVRLVLSNAMGMGGASASAIACALHVHCGFFTYIVLISCIFDLDVIAADYRTVPPQYGTEYLNVSICEV